MSTAISHLPSAIFYLLPLAGYWLLLIYNLGAQWSVYEQYHYGWAVPFLCLYLICRKAESRKQKAAEGPWDRALQKDRTTELQDNGTTDHCKKQKLGKQKAEMDYKTTGRQDYGTIPVVLWSLFLCALLYAPTRFLHEANPTWRLTSLLWTLEVIALTLLFLRSRSPAVPWSRSPVVPWSRGPVVPLSRSLFFPICFFLVAVPWPSGLENFLTQSLMRLNTSATVELLGFFGIPAVQHGSVIEVSTGVVGVDEACSGIRSLQATLMISLFLGELYALSAWRRALCVAAGFALAFVFNLGRTLLLTRVAAAQGLGAVAAWHDPAGITILVACFLCLWLVAVKYQKAESRKQKADIKDQRSEVGDQRSEVRGQRSEVSGQRSEVSSPVVPSSGSPVVSLSVVSWSLLVWLVVVEAGTELWYYSHERATAGSAEWSVHRPDQNATYTEVKIPPGISGQFRADEATQGRWQDGSGNAWQLYYFRWVPAHSLQKRVAIQLAKTHGPEKCLPAVGMKQSAYLGLITVPVAGMDLAMQQYVFNAEGRPLHVFYGIYEDPSGSSMLANRRKNFRSRIAAALAGSRNFGQRFLEVAVVGYERPEQARAALGRELEKLITVGGVPTGPRDN